MFVDKLWRGTGVQCKKPMFMGADSVWVYYGVKRSVGADSDELKLLETEKHPIFDKAFDAKLHVGWPEGPAKEFRVA